MRGKVLLVDDHPIVREGLARMINLEPDLTVCGEAEDVRSALDCIASLQPDVVVLDLSLNGPGGIEFVRCVRQSDARLPILMLSMYDDLAYAERTLQTGANGYIMKQEATDKVLLAIRRVLSGDIYVSDRVSNQMLRRVSRGQSIPLHSPVEDLTNREIEVFRLMGEGRRTREISAELNLSTKTVETYQAHIREKLGLKNGRELVQRAIVWLNNECKSAEVASFSTR